MPNSEQPGAKGPDAARTVSLSQKDLEDAARLFRLLAAPGQSTGGTSELTAPESSPAGERDRRALLDLAGRLIGSRRLRKQYFDRDIFGEPAWEILLALYVTEDSGSRLTMSRLADWIDAPLTTVARWVRALEEQSLIGRAEHPTDRRIIFVRLLDKGRRALDDYLAAIA